MALDAAEKMFYKISLKNKLLSQEAMDAIVKEAEESGKNLPDVIKSKNTIKPELIKKIVAAIEDKGQLFTKALFGSNDDEPQEKSEEILDIPPVSSDAPISSPTDSPIISSHAAPTSWEGGDDAFTIDLPDVSAETVTQPIILGQKVTIKESTEDNGEEEIIYENDDAGLLPSPKAIPKGLGDQLIKFLNHAKKNKASDFNMSVNAPAFIRRYGQILPLNKKPLSAGQTEKMLLGILTEEQKEKLNRELNLDFCLITPDNSRYRANIVRQKNGWDGTFRIIEDEAPSFDSLSMPDAVKRLTEYQQGLVLITGPKGCGKTTTMASMIDLINSNRKDHIITIEDPIEYVHKSKQCQVTQRALGVNTMSYANALRGALREDPDIIMVGELRDLDTISASITAAETGHLVLASLHTTSAIRTVDRIIDSFPAKQQAQIRVMIAESIRGIVCQQLLPRADGKGTVLALEILLNNISVRKLIIDAKTFQLDNIMQISIKEGMVRMDDSIQKLLDQKLITVETAVEYARNPKKMGEENG
ncbi:MAG: hypothetical protein COA79_08910 [Planctomycetota bacterium]|nr:MAG: hypothetical protein COA79_08910 [Planctomycetota bacterium]